MESLLYQAYPISRESVEFYQRNRYIKLKDVFDADTLAYYEMFISEKVQELTNQIDPLEKRDTYGKAFLQIFNLWRESDEIRDFVFSKRLAGIASALMQTDGGTNLS